MIMKNKNTSQTGKVVLYCRIGNADSERTELQLNSLRMFAKNQGIVNCLEFQDNGYSGNNFDRPAFAKMNTTIESGEIGTVIVRSVDRIARNFLLAEKWINNLKSRGIKFVTMDGSHNPNLSTLEIFEVMKAAQKRNKKTVSSIS